MPINETTSTPNASRLHIAIFGKRNSGKSSLINALTNTNTALVSEYAGTTTDPVYKAIEIAPIGPCVLIDTAGFDDEGELGDLRVKKTKEVIEKTDLAIIVFTAGDKDTAYEERWIKTLREEGKKLLAVINKSDLSTKIPEAAKELPFVLVSAKEKDGIEELKSSIIKNAPADFEIASITGHLVSEGDHVLLVAPQDIQAPKGRLILPQVQTIRDLLDLKAIVTVVTTDKLIESLSLLKNPPKLIITDSQVFSYVYEHCPKESLLTSFSMLFARYKGDIEEYLKGVKALDDLKESDSVLILEACTHNPLDGDIGRIKIPNLLRKKIGKGLTIDICSGNNLPEDLSKYSLAVHCGGCMFNRTYLLERIKKFKEKEIPITNYGVLIAKLSGILDKVIV